MQERTGAFCCLDLRLEVRLGLRLVLVLTWLPGSLRSCLGLGPGLRLNLPRRRLLQHLLAGPLPRGRRLVALRDDLVHFPADYLEIFEDLRVDTVQFSCLSLSPGLRLGAVLLDLRISNRHRPG